MVKTGIRAAWAVAITVASADSIVLSPPTQSACAPRDDQRVDGFDDWRAAVDVGFEQRQAEAGAGLAGFDRERGRVGLGRIPRDAHLLQAGERLGARGRRRRRPAGTCPGPPCMAGASSGSRRSSPTPALKGSATSPKTCRVSAVAIRVRHCLHRRRARREHQVELAGRDLSGDGVAGRQVALRVIGREPDRRAVAEAAFREAVDHAAHALVQDGRRGVLHDRDARDVRRRMSGAGCDPRAAGPPRRRRSA